jgi:hypothetical protein
MHLYCRTDYQLTRFVFPHRDLLIAIEALTNGKTGTQGTQEEGNAKTQRRKDAKGREEIKQGKGVEKGKSVEVENNTKAICFALLCFGSFFIAFNFFLFLVLVFLCAFASLRSLPPAFPFEPLCSRSRVVFSWANRQSECFGEAV